MGICLISRIFLLEIIPQWMYTVHVVLHVCRGRSPVALRAHKKCFRHAWVSFLQPCLRCAVWNNSVLSVKICDLQTPHTIDVHLYTQTHMTHSCSWVLRLGHQASLGLCPTGIRLWHLPGLSATPKASAGAGVGKAAFLGNVSWSGRSSAQVNAAAMEKVCDLEEEPTEASVSKWVVWCPNSHMPQRQCEAKSVKIIWNENAVWDAVMLLLLLLREFSDVTPGYWWDALIWISDSESGRFQTVGFIPRATWAPPVCSLVPNMILQVTLRHGQGPKGKRASDSNLWPWDTASWLPRNEMSGSRKLTCLVVTECRRLVLCPSKDGSIFSSL